MSVPQLPLETETPPSQRQRHWLGLPVGPATTGTLDEVLAVLPYFGRQPFVMASPNRDELGVNHYLDMVYRLPVRQSERTVPVGVVSKNYRLLDHHHILRVIQQSMATHSVDLEHVHVVGEWTVHGERAHFSIVFPPDELFTVRGVESNDEMRFRIEIFNSVDGSSRLMVVAGWLRFVCSNGLILGTALMQLQQQHRQQLEVEDLRRRVGEAIASAQSDRATLTRWISTRVNETKLIPWVDEEVFELWGLKAAVRTLGIATGGRDCEPVGDLKNRKPSSMKTRTTSEEYVPGVDAPVTNLFGVSQVLSWIAGQRADLSEDLQWRSQVHQLVAKLASRASG